MKIKLSLPSHFDHSLLDRDHRIDIPEDSTLEDLFVILRLPENLVNKNICLVNGSRRELGTRLEEGDHVAFFIALAGG